MSSVRVLKCTVKSDNERNPCPVFHVSQETASNNEEEGGDDAKSVWPSDALGCTHDTMGLTMRLPRRKTELIAETIPQFGLGSAIRPHEAGIASNRRSAMRR